MNPKLAIALLFVAAPGWAQPAPATKPAARVVATAVAESGRSGEPDVKRTVIEDEGSRIDELRVRGQTQRVVVTPKVGTTRSYEIIMSRNGRDTVDGTGGATSVVGKRVWNVLAF